MKKSIKKKFVAGDRVALIGEFRCEKDDAETTVEINRELREVFGDAPITGTVTYIDSDPNSYVVSFDRTEEMETYGYELYVDGDRLRLHDDLPPASEEEVMEAIRSIVGK